jgi:hypothetical protein
VDNGFSAVSMAHLVLEFHGIDANTVPQYTLPVVEDGQEYYYQGGDYGDVVFPIQPEDQQVVARFLGSTTGQDTSGRALPAPDSFTVAVENGSGVYDQGGSTATALKKLGYDVTSVTDTPEGATTTETTVLYGSPGQLDDALRVQSALSGLAVIGYDPGLVSTSASDTTRNDSGTSSTIDVGSTLSASDGADVVVVTGSNFAVNAPAGPPPSTSVPSSTTSSSVASGAGTGSTTTTTAPETIANNPNLAAPSGATQTLQQWDPRSCTPTGGAGP